MGVQNDNNYERALSEFKKYVAKNNKEVSSNSHEGYLVDYEDFISLQTRNNENQTVKNDYYVPCDSGTSNKPKIMSKSPIGLKNQIDSGKKFVLINRALYDHICNRNIDQNLYKINYRVSQQNINIYVDNEVLKFKTNDDNIIDKSTLIEESNGQKDIVINVNNHIDKIYDDVINYYDMEKELSTILNNQNISQPNNDIEGFIVDKVWDDKWKKYSYYDLIKSKYFEKNIYDKNSIINTIKEEQRKNYLNYDDVNDIEQYLVKDEYEANNLIKNENKSYAILNKKFLKSFKIIAKINPISLSITYQNIIKKDFQKRVIFSCKTNSNIISMIPKSIETPMQKQNIENQINRNNNIEQNQVKNPRNPAEDTKNNFNYSSEYLKHLIRTIYFKKEFLNPNSQFQNKIIQVNLIRKDIINDLKTKFKLNEIILKIENNNSKLEDITYQYFENNYNLILQAINKSDTNYFNSIRQYDSPAAFNFTGEKSKLDYKYINNQDKLKYIDNFEIIDTGFATFLQNFFSKNIYLPAANLSIIENLILLIINSNNEFIYEIVSYDSRCVLTIEFLMELKSSKFINRNQLNNYTFQNDTYNEIKNGISSGIQIKDKNNNIIFNVYPINYNNLSNSINNNLTPEVNNNMQNVGNNYAQFKQSNIMNNNIPLIGGGTAQNNLMNNTNNLQNLYQINYKTSIINNHNALASQIPQLNNSNQTQVTPGNKKDSNFLNKYQIVVNLNNLEENKIKTNKGNDDILGNNIKISMNLIKEKGSLIKLINQQNTNPTGINNEYYLINKNYIKTLDSYFHLNTINEIMKKNQNKNENEMINIIKENLPTSIKFELNGLNFNIFQVNSNDKNIYKFYVKRKQNKKSYFYKHCDIISNEFLNQLDKIDKNIRNYCIKIPCVFDNNKIIFLLNNEIINIANYKNNEIVVEYIIKSPKSNYFFEAIKKGGYNFISQYIPYDKINNPNNNIYMSIYKLTPDGKVETRISDKLKSLMYLSFSQNNYNDNTPQKVYLINPKWLKQFNYGKINEFIIEIISSTHNFKLDLTDLNSMSSIIPNLDKNKLKDLDNSSIYGINPSIPFDCSAEQIIILNEYLLIFKNFVLANQQSYEYLKNNFGIKSNSLDISYIHKPKEGDILIIKNYPLYLQQAPNKVENLILIGTLDRTKNHFIIKYILKFYDAKLLEQDMGEITKYNIKDFINQRVLLSEKIKNDYISPIFVNNQRVGTFYLYKKDFDYRKCFYYDQYLHNRQLMKSLYLFANKINLNIRLVNKTPFDEEFYLIRKNIILDIKKENNYEQYKQYFMKKIQIFNGKYIGDREKYILIKTMPKNDLYNLSKMNNKSQNNSHQGNIQINQTINEIDINAIPNPLNPNESFMIGKDFEIVEKICAHFLFKDINPNTYTKILCTFVGNDMIIFHYPTNAFNNNKYDICAISRYDRNKNDFINEYLIKYNTPTSYKMHINQIKSDLNSFLSNLKFDNNNIAKIINPGLSDIAIVIKIISSSQNSIVSQANLNNNSHITTTNQPINPGFSQINSTQTPQLPFQSLSKTPFHAPFQTPFQQNQQMFPVKPILEQQVPMKSASPVQPIPLKTKKSIKKVFKSKPLIGLENIGATCYMNATLQCLCIIEKFADYFKYDDRLYDIVIKDNQNQNLCTSFRKLIENLYPELNENKNGFKVKNKNIKIIYELNKEIIKGYYAPKEFKNKISQMNPLFEGIQANDAKDLVNFLIMTLHEELNKAPKNQIEEFNGNIFEEQKNKDLMFQNFSKNFMKTQQSIISDIFYALNYNMTQCSNCQTYSYNYQIYFFLIFPLEEVRKFKFSNNNANSSFNNFNNFGNMNNNFVSNINNNNLGNFNFANNNLNFNNNFLINNFNNNNFSNNFNNNFMNNNFNNNNFSNNFNNFNNNMNNMLTNNNNNQNVVDIMDCFEFERKVNFMSGDNAMYCNYCKQTCASSMCTILATGPEILIIILNRGKGIEFNVKLNFTQTLDLAEYIEIKETGCKYELIGVITHIGESSMSGHFIAYCREFWKNTWLKFNDAMVDPVKNFQSEVIDFAMPYLLFYKKIKQKKNN